jgi:hypothetical protein
MTFWIFSCLTAVATTTKPTPSVKLHSILLPRTVGECVHVSGAPCQRRVCKTVAPGMSRAVARILAQRELNVNKGDVRD